MPTTIEGRNAVIEALRSGMPVERVLLAEGVKDAPPIREIERRAEESGVPVRRVDRARLDRMSQRQAHQGVIAEVTEVRTAALEEIVSATRHESRSLLIALDHITDPGNLGAIARSAEVAGADALIVPKNRSAEASAVAFKSSAGALAHLPLVRETNLVRALGKLKDADYWIAGADGAAETDVWSAPIDGRLVIVVGAEGSGLSRLVRETCDFLVRLPVAGHVDSLNVAQATSVLAFEWVRRGIGGTR